MPAALGPRRPTAHTSRGGGLASVARRAEWDGAGRPAGVRGQGAINSGGVLARSRPAVALYCRSSMPEDVPWQLLRHTRVMIRLRSGKKNTLSNLRRLVWPPSATLIISIYRGGLRRWPGGLKASRLGDT